MGLGDRRPVSGAVRVIRVGDFVGLPFRDGGRDRRGVDCWGLVRLVYAEAFGIDLPVYGEISARALLQVARAIGAGAQADPWARVDVPRDGDVAVMRLPNGRASGHVGVVVPGGVLHAEAACGVAIEDMRSPLIAARITGFYRHEALR